jgi:hypothetical protein
MDPEILSAFDAGRNLSKQPFRSGCYAPYTSLYFDIRDDVRVCCHNWSNSVGNITGTRSQRSGENVGSPRCEPHSSAMISVTVVSSANGNQARGGSSRCQ